MESLPDLLSRCLTQHQERIEQRRNFLHPDTAAAAIQPIQTPTPQSMFNTAPMLFPHSRWVRSRCGNAAQLSNNMQFATLQTIASISVTLSHQSPFDYRLTPFTKRHWKLCKLSYMGYRYISYLSICQPIYR